MDTIKTKKSLEQFGLKINHMVMKLKELKKVLKPLRCIHRLINLKLDVKIKDKNNLKMLKSLGQLMSLSSLSVDLSENEIKY